MTATVRFLLAGVILGVACEDPRASFGAKPGKPHPHTRDSGDTGEADSGGDSGADSGADSGTDSGGDSGADSGTDTGPSTLVGIDVSGWDPGIDWDAVAGDGISFVYIKATEGTYYTSDEFHSQFTGAAGVGILRGSYHFANPSYSGAVEQADFFCDNGGTWRNDGKTLPGVLDFEWNPYDGGDCYGMSAKELGAWVEDFASEYEARSGRLPVIYTSKTYWNECVDSDAGKNLPLWVSDWGSTPPELPTGWSDWTFWQTADDGRVAGVDGDVDMNEFDGHLSELQDFAAGN